MRSEVEVDHLLHHEDDGMMGSFLVVDTAATAINKIENENEIVVFPNPAFETLTIISNSNELFSLFIFNSIGENISSTLHYGNFVLPITKFNNGLYFIQLRTQNKIITKKFIKQ